jgi:hypothetical protein
MSTFKIIFLDINGDELYSMVDRFYDEKDASQYANRVVANGRHNEHSFEIHEL